MTELSNEVPFVSDEIIYENGMRFIAEVDERIKNIGELKGRSTDVQISAKTLEQLEKTDRLMRYWLSKKDKVCDPVTAKLIYHLGKTNILLREELSESYLLRNLQTSCDQVHQEQRNAAGGKATKDKYSHILTVAKNVIELYLQKRSHMLKKGSWKRGAKKEIEVRIMAEMSKEENYKKANLISSPSSLTIQKYMKMAFEEKGLPK